jgi:hypothetical protein
MIITLISGSRSASWTALPKAVAMAQFKAFFTRGRFRLITAVEPIRSKSTVGDSDWPCTI